MMMQILDWKFNSMETHAKALVSAGVLKRSDIDAGMKGHKAEGHVMLIGVPAYSQVIELTRSAKANAIGILLGKHINKISLYIYYTPLETIIRSASL